MSDLSPSLDRFNRDRRRLTPRIDSADYNGGNQLTIHFRDRMDTRLSDATFRVFTSSLVMEFTNFTWIDDHTLQSSTTMLVGITPVTSPPVTYPFVRYIRGNVRGARRFRLRERTRTDRINPVGPSAPHMVSMTFEQPGGTQLLYITFDRPATDSADIGGWVLNYGTNRFTTAGLSGVVGNTMQFSTVFQDSLGDPVRFDWTWNGDDGPIILADGTAIHGPLTFSPVGEA